MRQDRRIFLAGVAASAMLSSARGGAAAEPPETREVTVGVLPIGVHAPVFAAQELGYFKDAGLQVKLQFGQGGAALLPLAFQGQLQFVQIPIATGLQAREQNFDVVMMGAGTITDPPKPPAQSAVVARANSPIRQLKDLAGKKFAVNVLNSVDWLYTRALIDKAGVDSKSLIFIELPYPHMIDALMSGQVDGATLTQPFLYFGTSSGKVQLLGWDLLDVQPGVQIGSFATTRKWATANQHTVAAFEGGVARAVDYMLANHDAAIDLVAKFTHTNREVVEGARVPNWSNELSPENITTQMNLMVKYGLLKKPQNVEELIWRPAHA